VLIEDLLARGAKIVAYDPVALDEARHLLGDKPGVRFATGAMDALNDVDALAIVTEWKNFRAPDFAAIKASLKLPIIFDGRNLYEPEAMRLHGFEYYPIGRPQFS
jgi:UDPglucose 6-dehydrogenase